MGVRHASCDSRYSVHYVGSRGHVGTSGVPNTLSAVLARLRGRWWCFGSVRVFKPNASGPSRRGRQHANGDGNREMLSAVARNSANGSRCSGVTRYLAGRTQPQSEPQEERHDRGSGREGGRRSNVAPYRRPSTSVPARTRRRMRPSDARAASRSGTGTTMAVTFGATKPRIEGPSANPVRSSPTTGANPSLSATIPSVCAAANTGVSPARNGSNQSASPSWVYLHSVGQSVPDSSSSPVVL